MSMPRNVKCQFRAFTPGRDDRYEEVLHSDDYSSALESFQQKIQGEGYTTIRATFTFNEGMNRTIPLMVDK